MTVVKKPCILIVDDSYRSLQLLERWISTELFDSIRVQDDHEGLRVLKERSRDVRIVIIDLKSSGMGGAGFLHMARQIVPETAILITAPLGPFLYWDGCFYELSGSDLKKNINTILLSIIRRARSKCGDSEKRFRTQALKEQNGTIIGRSGAMDTIYRLIENLKHVSATVLIQGESGTGKELVAKTIHQTGPRKNRPFVAINCGAIPHGLMESELFGHERGAFTSAVSRRKGKFETADGGTLFLDEIGELDRDLQVKLLRVLQEKEFQRVGGNVTLKSDVRVIAASCLDLKQAMEAGHFRNDLFYRLNVVPIRIPPLRERREDIPVLIDHFFRHISREMGRKSLPVLSGDVRTALLDYRYPGNVRELANIVERLLVTCPDGKILPSALPAEVCAKMGSAPEAPHLLKDLPDQGVSLERMEKELIVKTLEKTSGNKRAAARMLGMTRRLLYLRLNRYGLGPS
jgi:two-component system NtrC family response regulator